MATQGRRRALGQHFLKDSSIAHRITDSILTEASRHSCITLLEIGPGKGAMTHPILEALPDHSSIQGLILSEKDPFIATTWKEFQAKFPVRVESGDFLNLPEEKWLTSAPLAVVSNLPYSAAIGILTRLARQFSKISVMVLMFQLEVAQRVRAEASTKQRGSLSLWIQNRWDVRRLVEVPPGAFLPPPQVRSEVVVLTRRIEPRIQMEANEGDEKLWQSLLKMSFAHRRKMLRSVLPWQNALELAAVDGTRRAEALDWVEWGRLFQAVKKINLS